jgi:hypothetical protein
MKRRRLQLAACAALAIAAAQADGASKMFKCVEGGRTIYQQQACAVVAEPASAASAARASAKASGVATAAASGAKVKRASPAASSAPATSR